jgi:hypothetical protein
MVCAVILAGKFPWLAKKESAEIGQKLVKIGHIRDKKWKASDIWEILL